MGGGKHNRNVISAVVLGALALSKVSNIVSQPTIGLEHRLSYLAVGPGNPQMAMFLMVYVDDDALLSDGTDAAIADAHDTYRYVL
jgi:hypothetical protein